QSGRGAITVSGSIPRPGSGIHCGLRPRIATGSAAFYCSGRTINLVPKARISHALLWRSSPGLSAFCAGSPRRTSLNLRRELHYQAFAPAIFLSGQRLHFCVQLVFGLLLNHPSTRAEETFSNPHPDGRIGDDVLHPVAVTMLRNNVIASITLSEPDFDLARQAAASANSRKV